MLKESKDKLKLKRFHIRNRRKAHTVGLCRLCTHARASDRVKHAGHGLTTFCQKFPFAPERLNWCQSTCKGVALATWSSLKDPLQWFFCFISLKCFRCLRMLLDHSEVYLFLMPSIYEGERGTDIGWLGLTTLGELPTGPDTPCNAACLKQKSMLHVPSGYPWTCIRADIHCE